MKTLRRTPFPGFILAAALIAVAVTLASCGKTQEETSQLPTATSVKTTAEPTPTASPQAATVTPSPAPVPDDWATYSDPGGLFTVRYPPGWFPVDNSISSVDPSSTDKSGYTESIHVEFSDSLDDGYGCGVLAFDLAGGKVTPQQGATESSLGGIAAWKIVREPGDPLLNDPYTRIEAISAIHKGYCFNIAGYFRQQNPDAAVFPAIIATFRFTL